jgi:nucleoside-diphosphate kinase
MERTLIIYKPDCMEKRLVGTVLARFEQAGMTIVGCKMIRLRPDQLREHYAHVADRPFYPKVEAFMGSRPVIVMALAGDGIVARVRDLLGPTDSTKAAKGTIRGDFGTDVTVNIAHASDSPATGEREIARFFAPEELFG